MVKSKSDKSKAKGKAGVKARRAKTDQVIQEAVQTATASESTTLVLASPRPAGALATLDVRMDVNQVVNIAVVERRVRLKQQIEQGTKQREELKKALTQAAQKHADAIFRLARLEAAPLLSKIIQAMQNTVGVDDAGAVGLAVPEVLSLYNADEQYHYVSLSLKHVGKRPRTGLTLVQPPAFTYSVDKNLPELKALVEELTEIEKKIEIANKLLEKALECRESLDEFREERLAALTAQQLRKFEGGDAALNAVMAAGSNDEELAGIDEMLAAAQ